MNREPLIDPHGGAERLRIDGDGIRFAGLIWPATGRGPGSGRQVVLLHGVQNCAVTMVRIARAMAADGWRCSALDMPGHGMTRWLDGADDDARYGRDNVVRLVGAAMATIADRPVVIGHSWGGDTALAMAAAGADLEHAILIDPPAMSRPEYEAMAEREVAELRPGDMPAARAVVDAAGLITDPLDREAKAEALTLASGVAIGAVFRAEGSWRPIDDVRRWSALERRAPVDIIAGEPEAGGLLPDSVIADLRALMGGDRVQVLTGAGHSPQRTDFERFWPLLRAVLG
ncbi:MAG: alpha/beta fold hydrolase [Candidatus Limnocylindrales bacterium]